MTGHEKGVLSLSWCKQDADLLLSCGKDNRALCWNPQTSEIIAEASSNLHLIYIAAYIVLSFLLRTIGRSKWTGAPATQISSLLRSLTAQLAFTQYNRRTRLQKPRLLLPKSMLLMFSARQGSHRRTRLLCLSNSLQSGCVAPSQVALDMAESSYRSRIFLHLKAKTRAVWCTSGRL